MIFDFSSQEVDALRRLLEQYLKDASPDNDYRILEGIRTKLSTNKPIDLYIDGAADLHSKTAGIGGVFLRNGSELYSFSKFIGSATNNEAEYKALIEGLKIALDMNLLSLHIYSDSELLVKQIKGEYRVRNERIKLLYEKVNSLLSKLQRWNIQHVLRDKNKIADRLSKKAMHEGRKK